MACLVERANQDTENMIISWLIDNKTTHWAERLRFVQFMKNRAHHPGIARSPYEAMFGCPAKVGLKTSCLPDGLNINTEEQLEELLNTSTEENQNNHRNEEHIVEGLNEVDSEGNVNMESIMLLDKNQTNIDKKRKASMISLEK